jgi:hypothetical protein
MTGKGRRATTRSRRNQPSTAKPRRTPRSGIRTPRDQRRAAHATVHGNPKRRLADANMADVRRSGVVLHRSALSL